MIAKEFFERFKESVEQNKDKIKECYRYSSEFTPVILSVIENMIKGYDSNIETSREYFKIDLVAWTDLRNDKTKAIAESVSMKEYCWHLDIAVEHENDSREWYDEFIKISYVKCPLKVIICYNNDKNSDVKKIETATQLVKECNKYSFVNEEILIIMGNTNSSMRNEYDFGYRGYLLCSNDIQELSISGENNEE